MKLNLGDELVSMEHSLVLILWCIDLPSSSSSNVSSRI